MMILSVLVLFIISCCCCCCYDVLSADIDECGTYPCEPFGDCDDGENDYTCHCRAGFTATDDTHFCEGKTAPARAYL